MSKTFLAIIALTLLVGLVGCRPNQQMAPTAEAEADVYANYVGSEACAGCHGTIYNKFIQSGHPYKLTRVIDGQKPMDFPFSVLPDIPSAGLTDGDNTLGPPDSYADVSYVIGGYFWKARFVDTNGYIITGGDTQYNFATDAWVSYDSGVVDKPYNCGKCHTTGWISVADGGARKDGLPGMDGNFYKGGIHCEECHGPGAAHVNSNGNPAHITLDSSSELCGKCHTRDSERRIAASGGLIKHHEQYDELRGTHPDDPAAAWGKHLNAGIGCNVCHDPHATTVYQEITHVPGVVKDCLDCHADYAITEGPHTEQNFIAEGLDKPNSKRILNCLWCHMPKMSKSATALDPVGTGPKVGDIRSHIFKIDLSKGDQFTPDGNFAYPWMTAQYACRQCHNGTYFFDLPVPVSFKVHPD